MPAGFRRHLVGKTLNSHKCFSLWWRWNKLCWQDSDHTHIFTNQLIECYWNNTITVRPLTPHIMPSYTRRRHDKFVLRYISTVSGFCQFFATSCNRPTCLSLAVKDVYIIYYVYTPVRSVNYCDRLGRCFRFVCIFACTVLLPFFVE